MSSRSQLSASKRWKTYISFGSDIDLRKDGPGGVNSPANPAEGGAVLDCREILVVSGGVIVLQMSDKAGTNDTSPTLAPGTILPVQARKIIASGTTVTAVMVFW